jgi:hypothetical protein
MAKIPTLDNSQPILQGSNATSGAEGYEAFAKVLGSLGEKATEAVKTIHTEKSNSMYLSSVANIDQLKLSTQELILTDPANADKHVQTMRDSVEKVGAIAYVNPGDRTKLNHYGAQTLNAVELEGVKATAKQAQIGLAYEHYKNWPAQLNALKQAANKPDSKEFENIHNSMIEHLKSLALTGSLTPLQAGNALKSMEAAVDLAKGLHETYSNLENHSAQEFHKRQYNPFEPNKTNNVNYPTDENVRWAVNHDASDRSFQGAMNGIHNHQLPDFETVEKFTPNQRQHYTLGINGVNNADSLINSNATLATIRNKVADLEGKTDYSSVEERKYLKNYIKDWNEGNSQKLMSRTTIGGAIVKDYADKQAYLDNKLRMTDPRNMNEINSIKADIAKNKNDYVDKSVAYANTHGFGIAHPIPKEDVRTIEDNFKRGGNAAAVINTLGQYSKQNQMYVANEMKSPRHNIILQTIALGGMGNTDQEKLDFVTANQQRNYKEIDLQTEGLISNNYLINSFNTKIRDAIDIISAQNDPANATILNANLIQSSINYAKYLSEKKGDFSFEKDTVWNSSDNISNVVRFVNKSYAKMSGANYIVNKNQTDLDSTQMDYVSQYAIDEGNKFLRGKLGKVEYAGLRDTAPLSVTISPNNMLIAQDANGNIAFSQPVSSDLVAHATLEVKKSRREALKGKTDVFRPLGFTKARDVFKPINRKDALLGVEESAQKLIGDENAE